MVESAVTKPQSLPTAHAAISIKPEKILITLLAISVVLVTISFIGVVILRPYEGNPYRGDPSATPTALANLVIRFDVIAEGNIPSWYSGAILFIASVLLTIIAVNKHAQRDTYRLHWSVLAGLFMLFSVDEIAYLHEGINHLMRENPDNILRTPWVIPGAIFVLLVGLWYIPFVRNLPARTRGLVILAGCLFVMGALILELEEGLTLETEEFQSTIVLLNNHLQDLLEMIGVSLFIYALLTYIRTHLSPLRLIVR